MSRKTFTNEYGPSHRVRLVAQKRQQKHPNIRVYEDDEVVVNVRIKHF